MAPGVTTQALNNCLLELLTDNRIINIITILHYGTYS